MHSMTAHRGFREIYSTQPCVQDGTATTHSCVRVYQAYSEQIADAAAAANSFAAPRDARIWSETRMTWIKPSAAWMAYRCGWTLFKDKNQARVLALDIDRSRFEALLMEAVVTDDAAGDERGIFKDKPVVVQWDPEREIDARLAAGEASGGKKAGTEPFLKKLENVRSLQIGLRGRASALLLDPTFLRRITDVTVHFQAAHAALAAGDAAAAKAALCPDERRMDVPPELRSALRMDLDKTPAARWISPEDEEFLQVQRDHREQREHLGEEEWQRKYYTKKFHFCVCINEGGARQNVIELLVRDLSTAKGQGGNQGSGIEGGDMAYSGLHTWGSAVALSRFLLHNTSLVSGKSVLEVGSGTGLPSLAASRIARCVVASDRSQDLLDNVVHNASLNSGSLDGGETRLTTSVKRWEEPQGEGGACFDVVIGAEVMHEVPLMKHLAMTVKQALRRGGTFYSVCPGGARRAAVDAFKKAWSTEGGGGRVDEVAMPFASLRVAGGEMDEEWNYGSCEGDSLVLVTATVDTPSPST